MDLHHNLFYSYRGATAHSAERDRQIENNLTKALINTLSLGGESVWRPFLADLGLPAATHAKFLMQRDDLPSGGACKKRHRVLLGISKLRSQWTPGSNPCVAILKDKRPRDAWVHGDGFAVLVESKLTGDFSMDQMSAHLACLGTENGPAKLIKKTWGEINFFFFRALCPRVTDAPSRLLIRQFVQFLEYSAMTGFTGFQIDHFQYFLMRR